MGQLRIMTFNGDNTITWDLATEDAVAEAKRIFKEHRVKGATAFRIEPDAEPTRLDRFDPTAEMIVMVPRVAGG